MGPMVVIVGEPTRQARPQFGAGLKGMEIDALVLHGPPQAFDEDIVNPAAPAIHADRYFGLAQHGGKGVAGELTALIGIEDFGLAVTGHGALQSFDAKSSVHRVRDAPGQYLARRPVHDRHQIEEAPPHRQIGHVGAPHLIGPRDRKIAQRSGTLGADRWCVGADRLPPAPSWPLGAVPGGGQPHGPSVASGGPFADCHTKGNP